MGIATEVLEDVVGSAEGRLRVDHPFLAIQIVLEPVE
jgi:hypothetical protein